MYSNNKLNFQESSTIWKLIRKKSGNLSYAPHIYSSSWIFENEHFIGKQTNLMLHGKRQILSFGLFYSYDG